MTTIITVVANGIIMMIIIIMMPIIITIGYFRIDFFWFTIFASSIKSADWVVLSSMMVFPQL